MRMNITQGLDIPVTGTPEQCIEDGAAVETVAILGRDYHGMKPTMLVAEGDRVKLGEPLFSDKKNPGVQFTAPGAGLVKKINRGARRVLQSVVIELDGDEALTFKTCAREAIPSLDAATVRDNLVESGLWTALRTRPYSKIPAVDSTPSSIFVTAIDTRPLAADPQVVIAEKPQAFLDGVALLSKLAEKLFVCTAPNVGVPVSDAAGVSYHAFDGPHPAGLPGTHIHFLDPVHAEKTVWHINYQDVIAVGELFASGRLPVERVVALSGPMVERPRLLRTRLGANIDDLVEGELRSGEQRVVSGSLLGGHRAIAWGAYFGRYNQQITALAEGRKRHFLHWLNPTLPWFSALNVFFNSIDRKRRFDMNTSQNGSPRAMVPVGGYEKVMPLDILATPLLRALLVKDTDMAQKLGCLELDEEDLALCTFICHSKYEYGPVLRANLEQIEKEG